MTGAGIDRAGAIGIIRLVGGQPTTLGMEGDAMEPAETIETDSEVLSCDGGGGALGHPRVYLNMEGRGEIDCPYCGRRFVLRVGRVQGPGEKAAE